MRSVFAVFGLVCAALLAALIVTGIRGNYEYERTVGSYWGLSVKVSTLEAKGAYLDSFLVAVDSAHLHGHNATIFPTPDNDVDRNVAALRTLQARIHEARGMDPNGFAYQTAIQQITKQEQDEAGHVLDVIEGRWWLDRHPWNWDWHGLVTGFLLAGGTLIGFAVAIAWDN